MLYDVKTIPIFDDGKPSKSINENCNKSVNTIVSPLLYYHRPS